ncbi:hypothetical protein [Mycolicibacterium fortuitum]|uniref:hypothetical protein n=1 Tax=Mycolicibacterium fortuitum TaxID=1766 RepID=UPI001164C621|nr:hypothetical protein [Mycolicibacterium fortuitum]QDF19391.1 hypothetical protein SEA_CRACKLEWINK_105 [Mycobacterium phage Cracklewink]UBV14828.1 hypothetical protein H8Z57_29735 [Mycolicibacterium fortuitum]
MKVWTVWVNEEFNDDIAVLAVRPSVLDALDVGHAALTDPERWWFTAHLEQWDTKGGPRLRDLSVIAKPDQERCRECGQAAVVVDWPASQSIRLTYLCRQHLQASDPITVGVEALCRQAGTNIAPGVPIGMPACSQVCGLCIGHEDDTPIMLTCGRCGHAETVPRRHIRPDVYGPRCLCGRNDWRYSDGKMTPFRKAS